MSYRDNANCLFSLGERVDDAVAADAKRAQSCQAPPQNVAGERIAFEQRECILYGGDQRPIELEQLTTGATREHDAGHRSAGLPPLFQLDTQVGQRDRLPARELGKTHLDRGECL